ncbi:MAG: hypothetical protein QNJ75_00485 [Acidimicrobiia bacterium]|nr:hypothetical protein [Acidimicrobiia bacterium]
MSKEDPKHGRWILPLVVMALVLFTWTFVNNLPAAETPLTTTVAATEPTTTTAPPEETTTTTVAPEVIAFVATLDQLTAEAEELQATAQRINDEYPDTTGYGDTRDALSDLRVATSEFNDRVGEVEPLPAGEEPWGDVTTAAATMQLEADNMFDGLVNTSGSEKRLTALANYNIAAGTFVQKIAEVKEAVTEPEEAP